MDIALIILFLGVLIFLGNSLNRVFALTNIPDLLFLICIGLILGPGMGLISPVSFGIVGPIFTTVTLAIILFEGGLHLKVETIKASFGGAIKLTLISFFLTMALATLILYFSKLLEFLPSLMLGAIIGGTSSAVVIPMIEFLNLQKESKAILALESAITDVLSIVFFLSILDVYILGTLDVGITAGKLAASLLMAVILGIIGGIFWSSFYHRLGKIKSIFLTPAFLFIIYGSVDILGYSGAIAALTFGITLGNLDSFKISRILPIVPDIPQVDLHPAEKLFLAQLVQLLKTFFFIYIGLSIVISGIESLIIGCMIVLIIFFVRIVVVHYSVSRTILKRDASIMAIMIPKGLAAAVLAAIPLQRGVTGGQFIETTTYAIILYSIVFCSVLVILIERTPVKNLYYRIFSKFGQDSSTPVPP